MRRFARRRSFLFEAWQSRLCHRTTFHHYNFVGVHKTLRVIPGMEADLSIMPKASSKSRSGKLRHYRKLRSLDRSALHPPFHATRAI